MAPGSRPCPPGRFWTEPANTSHFLASKDEPVVFQLQGTGRHQARRSSTRRTIRAGSSSAQRIRAAHQALGHALPLTIRRHVERERREQCRTLREGACILRGTASWLGLAAACYATDAVA